MAKVCTKSDRYNCKYCSLAGRVCQGPPGYDRELLREEFTDLAAKGCGSCYRVRKWTFHYSDGTKETVTTRTRKP